MRFLLSLVLAVSLAGCGSKVKAGCVYDPLTKKWDCGIEVATPHEHAPVKGEEK